MVSTRPSDEFSENPSVAPCDPTGQADVLRILDANANRAAEGLRVVEEYLRFALDDAHLTAVCKSLRHELADVVSAIPLLARHAARDSDGDVGSPAASTVDSQQRVETLDVVAASLQRVKQALRVLEEYGKLLDVPATESAVGSLPTSPAETFERIRYRLYSLERAVTLTDDALRRIPSPALCVLVDGRESPDALARLAESLIAVGVHMLQLRDKKLPDRQLVERARVLREITRGTNTLFVVNDRADIARAASADGVHVGQDDLSVRDARRMVGPHALVGVSTHSLDQAKQAVIDGANYIGVGPVFPSATKPQERLAGIELLRQVARNIRLPAFAISGIAADNVAQVVECGVNRVAVSSAVVNADDPADVARLLLDMLSAKPQANRTP
jgi:thiamine-phosphate pyrophosphorylase